MKQRGVMLRGVRLDIHPAACAPKRVFAMFSFNAAVAQYAEVHNVQYTKARKSFVRAANTGLYICVSTMKARRSRCRLL